MPQPETGLAVPEATVEEHAAEIKRLAARSSRDIVEIGLRLIAVKAQLAHGAFLAWIDNEFGWSQPTASRSMAVARAFGSQSIHAEYFDPTALYALASGDVPQEIRQEFVERAQAGERVTLRQVREVLGEARAAIDGAIAESRRSRPVNRTGTISMDELTAGMTAEEGAGVEEFICLVGKPVGRPAERPVQAESFAVVDAERRRPEVVHLPVGESEVTETEPAAGTLVDRYETANFDADREAAFGLLTLMGAQDANAKGVALQILIASGDQLTPFPAGGRSAPLWAAGGHERARACIEGLDALNERLDQVCAFLRHYLDHPDKVDEDAPSFGWEA